MPRRLPPLKALRAFEAAAHRLSFTTAARDLSVTQTAVSHQIRLLEEWFDTPLFRRGARKLELTAAGAALYPAVARGFEGISEAAARVREVSQRRTLTISVTPTFGSQWLAERLGRFWREYPEVELRLHHTLHLADLSRDGVDAAVRWGRGQWPGAVAERLMRAEVTPVCSPALLAGEHPLRSPADLRYQVLLHERDYQEWSEWLAAAGAPEVNGLRGPVLDDANSIVRAALEGGGVMMGVSALLKEHLESGRLVAPFGIDQDPALAYYLVYLPGALEEPDVRAFRDFIVEETRRYEARGE